MGAKVLIALGIATLFLGCSGSTSSRGGASPGIYVSSELDTSFRVPTGWAAPKSWSLVKHKEPWAARFVSPDGEAMVTAAQAPYAGINCAAAAKAALAGTGGSLEVEKEFELKANDETLSAGTGSTSGGGNRGMARFFCRSRTAVVVEASAKSSAFDEHKSELETIIDSVSYDENSQQVAIRPPAAAPPQTFFQHTVRWKGQTLGEIAEWYTGEYDNWRKLARYNEDTPVPNVALKVGREIKIPTELVVKQDPMPKPKRRPTTTTSQKRTTGAKSEEEEAETTGLPKAEEEEAPELPEVIGPR